MMASSRFSLRRIILRFGLAASLVCLVHVVSPSPIVAKPRPPIEMGDPDGTGDQKPGTGPGAASVTPGKAVAAQGAALRVTGVLAGSSRSILISYLYLLWRPIIRM